jgi:AraC-like DNA-binding protein
MITLSEPVPWVPFRTVRRSKEGKHLVDFPPGLPLLAVPFRLEIDHHLVPNFHDYLEIAYICRGRGICEIGSRRTRLLPGDLVILGPHDVHTFWSDYRDPVCFLAVYFLPEVICAPGQDSFDREFLEPFYQGQETRKHFRRSDLRDDAIPKMIVDMYNLGQQKAYFYRHQQKALLLQLLAGMRTTLFTDTLELRTRHRSLDRLKPLLNEVNARHWERMTISEAATRVGCSRYYFCRLFKKVLGMTFVEYLNRTRIDHAKDLLLSSDHAISYIAEEVGFENISHFNKMFREFTGITPSRFRRIAGLEQ